MQDLIEGVRMFGPDVLLYADTKDDLEQYKNRLVEEHLKYPVPKEPDPNAWFVPQEYRDLDIESHVLSLCNTKEEHVRVEQEMTLYKKKNMLDVLRCMKYIVDTLKANNIVWGVGRGSSVASYVLFLLGVHRVDSIKYKLPIEEFFKETADG